MQDECLKIGLNEAAVSLQEQGQLLLTFKQLQLSDPKILKVYSSPIHPQSFIDCILIPPNKLIYSQYGQKLSLTLKELDNNFSRQKQELMLKLVIDLLCQLISNKCYPQFSEDNLYYSVENARVKVLATQMVDHKQFLAGCNEILSKVGYFKPIGRTKEIEVLKEELKGFPGDRYSIPNCLASISSHLKKNIPKAASTSTTLSSKEVKWILTQLKQDKKKLQLIHCCSHSCFDPTELHKAISNKADLLYLLQNENHRRIAFYTPVQFRQQSGIFGGYYPDGNKLSKVINVDEMRVYKLEDADYSVGYGKEICLAIGKFDLVVSAYNLNNCSYFPMSYAAEDHEELFGKKFTLLEMEVYSII